MSFAGRFNVILWLVDLVYRVGGDARGFTIHLFARSDVMDKEKRKWIIL